uniref:Secreted protein n=1 Tax=Knipowitschia caucasica TaxID=637954 RepID=A0AAV2KTL3_KNICA
MRWHQKRGLSGLRLLFTRLHASSVCRYTHYYSPKYCHAKVYCPLKLYSPGQQRFLQGPNRTTSTHSSSNGIHRPRKSNTNKIDIF